jgi:hypothetical protein
LFGYGKKWKGRRELGKAKLQTPIPILIEEPVRKLHKKVGNFQQDSRKGEASAIARKNHAIPHPTPPSFAVKNEEKIRDCQKNRR